MRYLCATMMAQLAVSWMTIPAVFGQAPPTLSVGNYQLVGEQRATRAEWYATYRAELINTGGARGPVTARVRSAVPAIQTVPGQDLLHFPAVPAGGRVASLDTFTVKIDRSVTTNFDTGLQWSFDNPVANAGQNQTVKVGTTVLLNAGNSSNPAAAGVLSYQWEFASRPAKSQATLVNPTSVNPSFTVDVPGTYVVSLTVSNGAGVDRSQVTISTVNSPPVANAGPNQTVPAGSTVTLDGSGSYDVDGDTLMLNWSFVSRPSGSLAVLSNNRAVRPTFVVDKPGTYIVQLIANDGTVDSAPSTVAISTSNSPPVANAGQNQTVNVGAVVQLSGAGSTDVDGDPLIYKWSFVSVPSGSTATLSSATAVNPTFTVDRAGTYVVQLIVNDGKIDSAPSTVTISTITIQPPAAVCGPNQTVLHGTVVTLSATCTDPQNLPLTYLWSLITRPAGSLATLSSTSAVSPTFVADKPGTFVAQLIVSNGTLSSQPCTTRITTTNATPVANAGQNQTVSVGATVALDGGGSYDPDQDPLTYSWSLLSRPSQSLAVLSGANSKNPTFIADEPGTYVAQLIVSDGFVSSAPATVTITAVAMKVTLSPNPLNLVVTSPGTLTVALGTTANHGGLTVFLTFDPAVVSMPSTVLIPSGAMSANVTVTPVAAGTSNVLATAAGFQAGTAAINVTTPSISLTVPSGIGLTRTVSGAVNLSAPAPVGGLNVTLTSNPAGIVTFNPTTVAIPAGISTGTFTLTGAAEGSATVTAAAAGYNSGTANVLVAKLGGISVPLNVTVAPGASAPLNISLTSPAPSGGATVNLVSSDTSIVTVTPAVFIPQGSTTPASAPQITGVNFGSATISASSPGYVGDSQTVTVTLTLTLSPQAVTVGVGGAKSINLLLSAPAPTGGLTVNLNSSNTAVATVPTSVIVPQGTTTTQFTVTSVAPGTATITAQAASPVIQPATATVSSVIFGTIAVPANTTVGLGQSVPFPITLSAAPPEAVTVNLTSSNTSRVTISPASVTVAAGQTQPAVQPQVTGAGPGAATITASASGYGTASGSVQTTATLSFSPSTLTIAGAETKTTNVVLSAPAPAGGLTVNLTSSPAGVVTIPASVTIAQGATQAQVSVQGVSGGTATITASATNVTSGTATVTVQGAGAIGLPSGVTLAPGQSAPFPVTLPTAAPADTTVTLTSNDSSKVTIAPASVVVLAGQTQPAAQPQVTGVNFGAASITASAPGYTSSSQPVTVAGSLSFSPQTLSVTGIETKTLTLTLSAPAPAGGLNVTIAASPAGVVTITGSSTIAAGTTTANVSVTGAAVGTATITASTATPNVTSATATVTVSSPGSLSLPSGVTVGLGQSAAMQVTLPAAAPPGGVTVTLASSDSSILTISPGTVTINAGQTQPSTAPQVTGVRPGNATITAAAPTYTSASQPVQVTATITFAPSSLTIPGTETRNLTLTLSGPAPAGGMAFNISSSATGVATVPSPVTIAGGQTSVTVPVTGVTPGAAVVRAQAPNLADATANITVTTPADIIVPPTLNISPGDSSGLSISLSRPESTNVFLEVTSNDTSKVTVTEPTVVIPAGQTQPSSNRVAINGVGLGTAVVTVRATNVTLAPANTTVVVAYSATLTPSSLTIAAPGLQRVLGLTLSAPAPAGGITFTATSSNPSVATLAPSILLNAGWSSIGIPVTAVAPGTAVIRLTSPVTQELTATVTVEPPGTVNLSAPATIGLSQTGTLTVTLSKPAPNGGVTVNLASSDPVKVSITPTTVTIPDGATQPATQPELAGVNLGTVTITATATGYTAAAPVTVNVNATLTWVTPTLTIVGVGVQGDLYLRLNAMPSLEGVFVNLSSSNPSVATIQPTGVFIWDGGAMQVIILQVTSVGVGTATIRASGVNVPEVTATVTVVGQMTITTASLPDGVAGSAYNAALAVAGGTAPYAWQAAGLPAGLAMNASTGQITGTPAAAGTSNVTVTVTDSSEPARTATKAFTLRVNPPGLTITTESLPAGAVGSAYNAGVAATGGTTPYAWSATGLPAGLTMNASTGQITGTPAAAGTASVNVTVTDASTPTPQTASKTFTLAINAPALSITTTSLPAGTVGAAYNATVAATGGTTPYTWSATGLPAGLTMNASTGQITGTPAAAGTSNVTVTVTDSTSPTPQTASKTLTLTVSAPAELTIATMSLPNGTVGVPYSAAMAATGGVQPYTWSGSRLPPGLSINPSTGQITGAPTEAGSFSASFGVTDANSQTASRSITMTVNVPLLTITTTALPIGTATVPYSATVAATGGTLPYEWSATGLPRGFSIDANTGQITGMASLPGASTVTVTVRDATNPTSQTASKTFTLTIVSVLPVIETETLPAGVAGTAYNAAVSASGGTPPYTWSATGLPAGLSINSNTGQITGTPTAAGTNSVTITVTDSSTPAKSGSKSFTLIVTPAPLVITTATLPNGTVGAAYNATVAATGGTPVYAWSAAGLPAGLSINTSTGQITGTPTAAGTSTVNVTVTDSGAPTPQTANKTFTVVIAPALLSITTATLPNGTAGAVYNAAVAAEGGVQPYNWSATGLPAGLSLNASTGQITGTPAAAGTSTVNVTVTDSGAPTPQTANKTFTLVIAPAPLVITTATLPTGVAGTAYNATVAASGGTPAYNWSATGLPSGLSIDPGTGQITGTPAAAGTSSVTVTVTDSGSPTPQTVSKTFSLTILAPLSITTTALPSGVINVAYSATVNATGGVLPYSWSAAGLPAGLSINASTGQITGTPTAAGPASVTVTVTDSSTPTARTATKTLPLVISSGLSITTASLPNGIAGTAYAALVEAAGGTQPYSWAATGLPAGVTINAGTGAITGIPTAAGTSNITVTVTDSTTPAQTASKPFVLTVVTPLTITTTSLPIGAVGTSYSAAVAAAGGTTPYTWEATGLPAGLTINAATGAITGTPTVAGGFPVAVTVTDSGSPTPQTATRTMNLVVSAAALAITTTSLPGGISGIAYSSGVMASGGVQPYTWSATGLPAGLTLNTATGHITGTPTAAGTSSVTVTVQDSSMPAPQTDTKTLTLVISPQPLAITTGLLPNGILNTPYAAPVAATGGTTPYTWSAVDLPVGLSINPATGQITGTPTVAGRVTATVTVADSSSPQLTASRALSINIVTALTVTTTSLPTGTVGTAYNGTVAAAGGISPYNWSATGLPAGLTIDQATGQISGTPTAAGTSSVTVSVTDTGSPNPQTATKTLSLVIAAPLSITTTSLPSGVRGAPYSATVAVSGGVAPYTWSASGLPPGLSIDPSTGQISGTPAFVGTSQVVISVADSGSTPQSVSKTLVISISSPPLALITGSLPNGTAGLNYSLNLEATGGTPPYRWEAVDLPDGLELGLNTGQLTGIPTTAGLYTVTITVSDLGSPQQSVTKEFSLNILTPAGPAAVLVSNATVGANLQAPITITFSPPPTDTISLTITSANPALVLLGNASASGTNTFTMSVSAGTASVITYAKALAGSGTVSITAAVPGYNSGTGTVTLAPSGFVLAGPNGIGAPFNTYQGVTTNLTLYAARLNGGVFAEPQQVRGGLTVNVPISTTITSVGTVSAPTVAFSGAMDSANAQFIASAVNTGSTDIMLTAPSGFTSPATGATVTATVQPSGLAPFSATIGKNLQVAVAASLLAPAPSSVSVTVESLDPAKLKFATSAIGVGSTSITVTLPAGQTSSPVFYAQAFDNTGTARYRLSAPGYGSVESTVALAPSGVVIKSPFGIGANFSMTLGIGNAALEIYTARLDGTGNYVESQLVAGGLSVSATVTSGNPSVGVITTSPVTINGGSNVAATEFQPLATGTSTVTASAAGYTPAVQGAVTATVATSTFLLTGDVMIGNFLQYEGSLVLPGRTPSSPAINVILQSNSPLLKLAKQATDAGSSSITITIPAGGNSAIYYLQAFASTGAATYTGSAPGYAPPTATVYFGPSGVVIFGNSPVSLAGGPKPMTVLAALLDSSTMYPLESMQVAGGVAPVVVGLNSSSPPVGTVPATVSIPPGQDSASPNFTPVATGTTVISVTQPSGWATPSAFTTKTMQVVP